MDLDTVFGKAFGKWKKQPLWFAGVGILAFIVFLGVSAVFYAVGASEVGAILGLTGFWIIVIAAQEGRKKFFRSLRERWLEIGVAGLVCVLPLFIGLILFLLLYALSDISPLFGLAGVFTFIMGFAVMSVLVTAPYRALREDWQTAVRGAFNFGRKNFATVFLTTLFFATSVFFLAGIDVYFGVVFNILFFYHIIAGVYYELAFSKRTTREA